MAINISQYDLFRMKLFSSFEIRILLRIVQPTFFHWFTTAKITKFDRVLMDRSIPPDGLPPFGKVEKAALYLRCVVKLACYFSRSYNSLFFCWYLIIHLSCYIINCTLQYSDSLRKFFLWSIILYESGYCNLSLSLRNSNTSFTIVTKVGKSFKLSSHQNYLWPQ